ncbi:MAG: transcription-repair coupling factor [Lachnospiraceae bacterium]|nr:transcription-repair coupling factor [Lachnospiraceae bacterium]
MKAYLEPLQEISEYLEIEKELLLGKKLPVHITGCIDSQKCHLIAGLAKHFPIRLIITENDLKAQELCEEYRLYDTGVLRYPAKDVIFYSADIHGNVIVKERLRVIKKLLSGEPVTVVTSMDGGIDRLRPLAEIQKQIISLAVGDVIEIDELLKKLVALGYERQGQVEIPGEFAVRGGIIDVFPLTEEAPVRIELFDDEIDTIRVFDVGSQRTVENIDEITVFPATEYILTEQELARGKEKLLAEAKLAETAFRKEMQNEEAARVRRTTEEFLDNLSYCQGRAALDSYVGSFFEETVSFFDYFGDDALIVLDEPSRVKEKAETTATEFRESMTGRLEKGYILPSQAEVIYPYSVLLGMLAKKHTLMLSTLDYHFDLLEAKVKYDIPAKMVSPYNSNFELLVKDLGAWKKKGYRTVVVTSSGTRAARLAEDLRGYELPAFFSEEKERVVGHGEIMVTQGNLRRGFEYPAIKFVMISESDIFGAEKKRKKKTQNYDGQKINSFTELSYGDYVVHENQGLGIYRGIEKIEVDKIAKDYIKIEYGDGGVLYIPATGLDVIQKYASADAAKKPKLNRMNSVEWKNTKTRVRHAVKEMAGELVRLYAHRQEQNGFAFDADSVWQKEFEELFPYEETDDQLRAIEDTKRDMESRKIMDRLICGDVGYGKTEIAIRAAFKAVENGKQVVVLVPTTILAQQHYNTFVSRMINYPVTVGMLSRFRTPAQQKQVLDGLSKGKVDIVIGTHRVLSKDVTFKNLGLLIVDEEQRFGVAHKEKIKQMKENIDVLTLTATPIPRTLHMSLAGIRDMSVLEEPPVDRLPIQTFVMEHNDEIIKEAIHRELLRGGQVYYVFNRVHGIEETASHVARLVPEANVSYAHGQMSERQLEKIMYEFINGEIDVLISTTIIETGLDISNANTMIIDDADRMGLSQLYQLRGRVGRSSRTSYAFLMYKRDKMLKEVAEKRLQAIRQFTELGSGFKIAMRDLEIRGAGNLLGAEQSGHMEAVGYDLYCKMLNEAVKNLKGEVREEDSFETVIDLDVDAYIPATYIRNEVQKLDMYKRVAEITSEEEKMDLTDELVDRFGDLPNATVNLLQIASIKAMCHDAYISALTQQGEELKLLLYPRAKIKTELLQGFLEERKTYLKFVMEAVPYFVYRLPKKKKPMTLSAEANQLFQLIKDFLTEFSELKEKE